MSTTTPDYEAAQAQLERIAAYRDKCPECGYTNKIGRNAAMFSVCCNCKAEFFQ